MTDQPEPVEQCQVLPEGWYCTRAPGHEGPCAALPLWPGLDAFLEWRKLPAADRGEDRPWIMGFNAGWDEALRAQPSRDDVIEECAAVADRAADPDPAFTCCEETARDIAAAIRTRKESQ